MELDSILTRNGRDRTDSRTRGGVRSKCLSNGIMDSLLSMLKTCIPGLTRSVIPSHSLDRSQHLSSTVQLLELSFILHLQAETWCLFLPDAETMAECERRQKEQQRQYNQRYWQRLKGDPERYAKRISAIMEKRRLRRLQKKSQNEHPQQ